MSTWGRGLVTTAVGTVLFVLTGLVTLYGGRWLIPLFTRLGARAIIIVLTVGALLMILAGIGQALYGMRRRHPTSN